MKIITEIYCEECKNINKVIVDSLYDKELENEECPNCGVVGKLMFN